jgi:hypothetical protein
MILDFMTLVDPEADQAKYIQMKQDMTGLWFTEGEEFKNWMNTRKATLWLCGIREFPKFMDSFRVNSS